MRASLLWIGIGLWSLSGCGAAEPEPADVGPGSDAGALDSGSARDASPQDAAPATDATPGLDAGDAGADAGAPDSGPRMSGLRFFDPTVLHRVEIEVAPNFLDALDNDTNNRVPCTIRYDGDTVENAGIRKKGQTSLRPLSEKPSFSVKLDETVAGADIDGIEKFALNNTLQDRTYLSEPLTYLLYQRAGVPAPRTAHAVVVFNGETKGIYVVVEATNKEHLRNHYGDGNGNLYEGPWDFTQGVDNADLKDLEDGRTRDDLTALTQVVLDTPADQLEAALAPLADLDNLFTTVAVDMAFCLWDGYTVAAWNFYLYHVPAGARGPSAGRFVLLPHGADWPYWRAELDPLDPNYRPWGEQFPPGLLAVRLTDPPFAERYLTALRQVRDQAFDLGVLEAKIDQVQAILQSADRQDPVLDAEVQGFLDGVGEARAFVAERRAFLDAY